MASERRKVAIFVALGLLVALLFGLFVWQTSMRSSLSATEPASPTSSSQQSGGRGKSSPGETSESDSTLLNQDERRRPGPHPDDLSLRAEGADASSRNNSVRRLNDRYSELADDPFLAPNSVIDPDSSRTTSKTPTLVYREDDQSSESTRAPSSQNPTTTTTTVIPQVSPGAPGSPSSQNPGVIPNLPNLPEVPSLPSVPDITSIPNIPGLPGSDQLPQIASTPMTTNTPSETANESFQPQLTPSFSPLLLPSRYSEFPAPSSPRGTTSPLEPTDSEPSDSAADHER